MELSVTLLVALELISKKLDIDPSLMVYYKCKINEKPKKRIIMKDQKRDWDESRSPQWKFFQENERKERKNEKKT